MTVSDARGLGNEGFAVVLNHGDTRSRRHTTPMIPVARCLELRFREWRAAGNYPRTININSVLVLQKHEHPRVTGSHSIARTEPCPPSTSISLGYTLVPGI